MDAFAQRIIDAKLLPTVYRAVEPAYPHEGCGFIFEQADGGLYVIPTENRAEFLHQRDPVRYPRGGADWFEPHMKPWFQAVREGNVPRVIFHSHPDVGAYFSKGDHDSAVMLSESGDVVERNPGVDHIVVSVRDGRADGAALFRFDRSSGAFCEVARFDHAGAAAEVH